MDVDNILESTPAEVGGITTLGMAFAANIWNMISEVDINGWFVVLTSIGGLLYLIYKIRLTRLKVQNEKKRGQLLDQELEENQK